MLRFSVNKQRRSLQFLMGGSKMLMMILYFLSLSSFPFTLSGGSKPKTRRTLVFCFFFVFHSHQWGLPFSMGVRHLRMGGGSPIHFLIFTGHFYKYFQIGVREDPPPPLPNLAACATDKTLLFSFIYCHFIRACLALTETNHISKLIHTWIHLSSHNKPFHKLLPFCSTEFVDVTAGGRRK